MSEQVTFSLLDKPWIPVRLTDGSTAELSLLGVFERLGEIEAIVGELPAQSFALLRLLLAVLYGALDDYGDEEKGPEQWKTYWDAGFPTTRITAYLEAHRDRFDLLHPLTPFYQVADLRTARSEVSSVAKLVLDVPNGEPFFTTRIGEGLVSLSFAESARWLVATQAFDISGIKSGAEGDPRVNGGKGYPIGTGWSGYLGGIVLEAESLHKTLLLNFPAFTVQDADDWAGDVPIWERDAQTAAADDDAVATGPAALYTWQSRRIRLHHDGSRVTGVVVANGDKLTPQNQHPHEPMTPWRRSKPQERALKLPLVYMPQEHDPTRSLWRGIANFLPSSIPAAQGTDAAAKLPPLTSRWQHVLYDRGLLTRDQLIRIHAIGLQYGSQSSVTTDQVDDTLSLHLAVFAASDPIFNARLDEAAKLADDGVIALRNLAGNIAAAEGRDQDGPRRRAAEQAYAALDDAYRRWAAEITIDTDLDEAIAHWKTSTKALLRRIGNGIIERSSAKAWRGGERGGRLVNTSIADILFTNQLAKIFGAEPPRSSRTKTHPLPDHQTSSESEVPA